MVTPAQPEGPGPRKGRARTAAQAGAAPVWLLSAAMTAAALWLYLDVLPPVEISPAPRSVPWWALAAGFCLAEVAVVNYDFRRAAHSFSMYELPLAVGLFTSPPRDLVLATVVGVGLALLLHRRQSGLKLLFNLGHSAMGACLAVLVFHAVAGAGPAFTPTSWIAVLLATMLTSTLSTAAIVLAIALSERQLELAKLPEQYGLALLTTVGSASLGLMGVGLTWQDPTAAWLLVVPLGTFFLAYRGYVRQRQERDSLEFLYRSSRVLDQAPDLTTGMSSVLRSACDTLRAGRVQFALLSPHQDRLALLLTCTGRTISVDEQVGLDGIDELLRRALQSAQPQTLRLDPPLPGTDGEALRQVLIAPLRTESQRLGALLVANRLGSASSFTADDLRLLETLATQLSVSLENGRLARTLTETARRADRERDNALVLQRSILPPPLPRVPGASVAVRYLPGAAGVEVCGDWYDVLPLPCGDAGLVIGDVLGHDLQAAARMGQARSALRAYAADGHPPAAVVERLNRLLTRTDPDFLGTCCYLQFSPRHDTVTMVSAGHPPPLLISPDGDARPVELETNLPLGVDDAATYSSTVVGLPPGATLVLYTDGLVESRSESLDVGLARLADVPAQARGVDLETLADRFLTHGPPDHVRDDVTLLLLRSVAHREPLGAGVPDRRRALPADQPR